MWEELEKSNDFEYHLILGSQVTDNWCSQFSVPLENG